MSRYAGRHRPVHPLLDPGAGRELRAVAADVHGTAASRDDVARSRSRRVVRVVGGAAAVALLGAGAVSSMSLAKVGDHTGSAATDSLSIPPEAALQAVAFQADVTELTDQRADAGRTVNLRASAGVDAVRAAQQQSADQAATAKSAAAAKAAADAQAATAAQAAAQAAQAAADAAAAETARAAEADRAARAAERATVAAAADAAAKTDPRSTAKAMLASYGWSVSQFSCLDSLWTKESGWNPLAVNASSGAYGIPQSLPASKMATAGADYRTNPATQIAWGLTYIKASYGNPCSAWAHSQSVNWY